MQVGGRFRRSLFFSVSRILIRQGLAITPGQDQSPSERNLVEDENMNVHEVSEYTHS